MTLFSGVCRLWKSSLALLVEGGHFGNLFEPMEGEPRQAEAARKLDTSVVVTTVVVVVMLWWQEQRMRQDFPV